VWIGCVTNGTMFVEVPADNVWQNEFRECVIAVMEMAELLECHTVVICVAKTAVDLMRSFMYAGFEMVHPDMYCHKEDYVLLGCEV